MRRAQWIAFGSIFLLAVLVGILVLRNPHAPPMPDDREHVWRNTEDCMFCHGPDGAVPQSPNHPVGRDCMRCHQKAR